MLDMCIVGASVFERTDIKLGVEWIRECRLHHPECMTPNEPPLPSRVLELGRDDYRTGLRLKHGSGLSGDYVTLSHCWGGRDALSTTSQTYSDRLHDIPYESLPRTYRDAVKVTHQLGYRYLWIDSLCIMQDSVEDWEKECVNMPQIYQNSVVTITGPSAANSDAGFLEARRRIEPMTCDFQCELSKDRGSGQVEISYIGHQRGGLFLTNPEANSAVSKRGWVLQERLLSPRVLYFGTRQMYWECLTNVRYEGLQFPLIDNYQVRNEVKKISFLSSQTTSQWLRYWYQIVVTYSATAISLPSDKLPALSGLANKIQGLLGFHYLAGIWKEDLIRGLSWSRHAHRNDWLSKPEILEYRAPSWSWASQNGKISYYSYGVTMDSTFRDKSVDVVNVHVEAMGGNPFGRVLSGLLKLRGKIRKGTIRKLPHHIRGGEIGLYLCHGGFESSVIGEYFPDNIFMANTLHTFTNGYRSDTNHPVQYQVLFILLSLDSSPVAGRPMWVAMAVEKLTEPSTLYRRVGIARNDCSQDEAAQRWFDKADEKVLEII